MSILERYRIHDGREGEMSIFYRSYVTANVCNAGKGPTNVTGAVTGRVFNSLRMAPQSQVGTRRPTPW